MKDGKIKKVILDKHRATKNWLNRTSIDAIFENLKPIFKDIKIIPILDHPSITNPIQYTSQDIFPPDFIK